MPDVHCPLSPQKYLLSISSIYRTVIEFPSESIVCVIYEVQCGSTSERDVFELVKKHSKGYGVPIGISFMVELEPGVRKVKVHHHK